MKNRSPSTLQKLSPKHSDTDLKKTHEKIRKSAKALGSNHSFLQKGARLLQNYSTFLTKSLYQGGDPELYFKQTLRNYDLDFSSVRSEGRSLNQGVNRIRSTDILKPERRRSASYIGSGDNKDKYRGTRNSRPPSSKLTQRTHRTEDDDSEAFYSPASFASKVKMAEEEVTEDEMGEEEGEGEGEVAIGEGPVVEKEGGETEGEEEGDEGIVQAPSVEVGEDPLKETEELVKKAEDDLDQLDETLEEGKAAEAAEEKPKEEVIEPPLKGEGDKSKSIIEEKRPPDLPKDIDDKGILREVAECETQCAEISKILVELKKRVTALLSKPSRSPEEDRELDRNQRELNDKMMLLEQKTKKVEYLMTMSRARAQFDQPQTEDILPKVILCGVADNNMPNIIVCDDKKKKKRDKLIPPIKQKDQEYLVSDPNATHIYGKVAPGVTSAYPMPLPGIMPIMTPGRQGAVCPGGPLCPASKGTKSAQSGLGPTTFAQRLCESYNMQEKLAAENADLEGKRYQLQSDLLNKDQTVESLQRKLASLQAEMRMVLKENTMLNDKLERAKNIPGRDCKGDSPRPTSRGRKMSCCRGKVCRSESKGHRGDDYGETTQQLEKQLTDMEEEVRKMQTELLAVRQERMHLEQHRRMLCVPPPCGPAPGGQVPGGVSAAPQMMNPPRSPCPGPCNPNRPSGISADQQLRELREQYNTLQDDYKGKLVEVSGLRADVDKLKKSAAENEETKKTADKKIKDLEKELKELKGDSKQGTKESKIELEQQLSTAKQRYREVKDELEEVRALVEEQKSQLGDYRNKYLQAQQQVEEQRRQIDMMELENGRISEQVNLEIQRVKNQFQEKLQELTPLPDILKATQLKLQEAQQMHLLAERNNEALVRELQAYRDKAAAMAKEMNTAKSMASLGEDEKATMQSRLEELQKKCDELTEEGERAKTEMIRLKEVAEEAEKTANEKMHQIAQLSAEVDNVREESARQVARTKDRCETVRRSMQNQISDMERQLAQSRAQAKAAQKDRDEIRQKMQAQINNLNENFEDAQMRIRNLQGHVNFLKNTYTNVFPGEPSAGDPLDPCTCANTKF